MHFMFNSVLLLFNVYPLPPIEIKELLTKIKL